MPAETIKQIVARYREEKGALIPVLQATQEALGYLPPEALKEIAAAMDLPLSTVYSVVTFYAQFHLQPRGRHVIHVCQGTACHIRGGNRILNRIKELLQIDAGETTPDLRFTLEPVACLGACALAPVMSISGDTYGHLKPDMIAGILEKYQ